MARHHRLPDDQVADLIRADEIDILVDLSMHMTRNRLRVFAQARAGADHLAGLSRQHGDERDRLSPVRSVPRSARFARMDEGVYAERTLRLPETFWCYHPLINDLPVNALPVAERPSLHLRLSESFLQSERSRAEPLVKGASRLARLTHSRSSATPAASASACSDVLNIDPTRVLFFARRASAGVSGALSPDRPVPRHLPLQRPHHHPRRPLDGRPHGQPARPARSSAARV